ncbi:Uncharacterised protein [uncultured archaeon]|nr:Uncharacterised protein [uncultured archaeon]
MTPWYKKRKYRFPIYMGFYLLSSYLWTLLYYFILVDDGIIFTIAGNVIFIGVIALMGAFWYWVDKKIT